VPELTHDPAEEGFHEIQLSGKQIVFLFMAVTVVSAVIFLFGVLVGRGVRAERGEAQPISSAAPASQPVAEAGPAAAEPPVPAAETPDELSYHKRLQGETPAAEQLKPEAPAPSPAPAASAPPAAAAAPPPAAPDVPTAGKPGSWVVQVTALRDATAAQKQVRDLVAKGFPAFLVNPAPGMPVIYRVQIGGYANRGEAEQISRRLETEENFKPVVRQIR